jgi:hypothetical protein
MMDLQALPSICPNQVKPLKDFFNWLKERVFSIQDRTESIRPLNSKTSWDLRTGFSLHSPPPDSQPLSSPAGCPHLSFSKDLPLKIHSVTQYRLYILFIYDLCASAKTPAMDDAIIRS